MRDGAAAGLQRARSSPGGRLGHRRARGGGGAAWSAGEAGRPRPRLGDATPSGRLRGPASMDGGSRQRPRAADTRNTAPPRGSRMRSCPPPHDVRIGRARRRSASCRAARPSRCGSRAGCIPPRLWRGSGLPSPSTAHRSVTARRWWLPCRRRGFPTTAGARRWKSGCRPAVCRRRERGRSSSARGPRSRAGVDTDFADLFEVKDGLVVERDVTCHHDDARLTLSYRAPGGDGWSRADGSSRSAAPSTRRQRVGGGRSNTAPLPRVPLPASGRTERRNERSD